MKSIIRCVALFILVSLVSPPLSARAEYWDGTFGVPGMSGGYSTWSLGVWNLVEYNGGVVACGNFAQAGGVNCSCIARWNGSVWSPLGAGLNGLANRMVVLGGDLYVGGWFTKAGGLSGTANIARWDGQAWHSVGGGLNDVVYALGVCNDELVVGGRFTMAGQTPVNRVARWDGAEWHAMGAGFTAGNPLPTVWCFAEYGGELVAGGRFSLSGTDVVNRIALWNGSTWRALGGGVASEAGDVSSVYDLTILGEDLIVGGEFIQAGTLQIQNLARWDGSQWHAMIESGFRGVVGNGVSAVSPYRGGLVIGGMFGGLVGLSGTTHLAYWNGQTLTGLGNGTNGNVEDLLVQGDDLLVSGVFTQAGATVANHIARWRSLTEPPQLSNGSIVAWGSNYDGECTVPASNLGFAAVAAGESHSLGLRADGSIVAWGFNNSGQCTAPAPNTGFTAVEAGNWYSLGLRADGSIVAWGDNSSGQCTLPAPNTSYTAMAAGWAHSLGLKADGSIVAWGRNTEGQCNVPPPNTGFAAVSAGMSHSLGLKSDGSIVAWGANSDGQCNVPSPNTGFTAVATCMWHNLGLRADGSIVAWGSNSDGQCSVPAPNTGFTAVAAGYRHSLGLKIGGAIVAWGDNYHGQCDVSAPDASFRAVAAGGSHSLAILGEPPVPVYLASFTAERRNGEVLVRWAISQPVAGAGFHLWRQEPGHERTCLSQTLLGGQTDYDFTDPAPPTGPADYWLQEITTDGSSNWYGPAHLNAATVPSALRLYAAAPNPFNPRTTIRFDLPAAGPVRLSVYDLAGRRVRVLVEGERAAGSYEAVWDGRDATGRSMPSGSYLARLVAGGKVEAVRLSLVR